MKNIFKILFSAVLLIGLIGGLIYGYYVLTHDEYKDDDLISKEYNIIVDDEVRVCVGDTYTIVPYLMSKNGSIEESRFQYTALSDAISVSEDGVVTILSLPKDGEDVKIKVFDRNTSVETEVKLIILEELSNVLGITISDETNNKTLIEGEQKLSFGRQYFINVVAEPKIFDLADYCSITCLDEDGTEKEAFDISFNNATISLSPTGLGVGKLLISISDPLKTFYEHEIDFSISLQEKELGDEILENENKTLLSKEELNSISSVTISSNIEDISELSSLLGLNTIVLSTDSLMNYTNIPSGMCYRVKTSVYEQYVESEAWEDYINSIIPYENSPSEIYVVYHNSKYTNVSDSFFYRKVIQDYEFPSLSYKGYVNTAWKNLDDNEISEDQVKQISINGIHLFAVWRPIEYNIRYNVRVTEVSPATDAWNYESQGYLRTFNQVCNFENRGYNFMGWTTDPLVQIGEAEYLTNQLYGQDDFTTTDGVEINLYDVWSPIEYEIRFEHNPLYEANTINSITLKYDDVQALPTGVARGYTFNGWSLGNKSFNGGEQITKLTDQDHGVVTLLSTWIENSYTLSFEPAGGNTNPETDFSTYSVTLLYSQPYTLKELFKVGYSTYFWYADVNGNGRQDGGEATYDKTQTISKVVGSGEVILRAVWSQCSYKVNYNLNGGTLVNGTSGLDYDFEEYFTIPEIVKTGWAFAGWTYNGNTYNAGDSVNRLSSINNDIVTLTAHWVIKKYTVKFDSNGGSVDALPMVVNYDELFVLPVPYGYVGHTFKHWSYNGSTYNGGESVSKLTANNNDTVTLSAEWRINTYTIHYNALGGNVTPASQVVNYDSVITLPTATRAGYTYTKWTSNGIKYNPGQTVTKLTAEDNDSITFTVDSWTMNSYTVKFDANGGSVSPTSKTLTYEERYTLPAATNKLGYTFVNWSYNGKTYTSGQTISQVSTINSDQITFKANWRENTYTIQFNANGGSVNPGQKTISYWSEYMLPTPSRVGHSFEGWSYNGTTYKPGATVKSLTNVDNATVVFVAKWKVDYYTINIHASKATIVVSGGGYSQTVKDEKGSNGGTSNTLTVPYGTSLKVDITYVDPNNQISYCDINGNRHNQNLTSYTITMPNTNITIDASSDGCFAKGTLILLADGTQKPIEEIQSGDMIMSWNFITGKMESMPVSLYWNHGEDIYTVINLQFSNGSLLRVITEHGLFDYDLNKFVFINLHNYMDYVNHKFVSYNPDGSYYITELTNAYLTTEQTGSYSLRSACNDNAIAGNMLTLTVEDVQGFLTYFEVGEGMRYDQEKMQSDIEKYGLYTYEEWAEYVSYEEFVALNGQYLKILIGKGILTYEKIFDLIEGMR